MCGNHIAVFVDEHLHHHRARSVCRLAIGGYAGLGKLIALPLSTPPEIGARGVGLPQVAAVSCNFHFGGPAYDSARTGSDGIGAAAFESAVPITVVTPRRTGGTSLALAETSSAPTQSA